MPLNGSGTASPPAGTEDFVPNTTITSASMDALRDDIYGIFNTPRPIPYGGTGAGTAIGGIDNLSTKSTDIAAATTTNIGTASGQYAHITGSGVTVGDFDTKDAGVTRVLVWDDVNTITHSASIILQGGVDRTTAAGDTQIVVSEGAGVWREVSYSETTPHLPPRMLSQQVGTVATGTTLIPHDNTIPQITEGDEYLSLAITPTSATNTLKIEVVVMLSHSSATYLIPALFQDSTADALKAASEFNSTAGGTVSVAFTHVMTAGTTSATTFRVRCGGAGAGTTTFNGDTGTQRFGGVAPSSIIITEIGN